MLQKNDSIEYKRYDDNSSVKNTALTAKNEESLIKTKNDIVVEKDLYDKGKLNGSTERNKIMNIDERKHEKSDEVKGEDAFNTAWKKQKI